MVTETHTLPLVPLGGSRIRADQEMSGADPVGSIERGTFENVLHGMRATAGSRQLPAPESKAEARSFDETGTDDQRVDNDVPADKALAVDTSEPKTPTDPVPSDGDRMTGQGAAVSEGLDLSAREREASFRTDSTTAQTNPAATAADRSAEARGAVHGSGVAHSARMLSGTDGGRVTVLSGGAGDNRIPALQPTMTDGHEGDATNVSKAARGDQTRGQTVAEADVPGATGSVEQQGAKAGSQAQFMQVLPGLKETRDITREAVTILAAVQANRGADDAMPTARGHFVPEGGPNALSRAPFEEAAGLRHRDLNTFKPETDATTASPEEARVLAERNRPEASVDRVLRDRQGPGWVSENGARSFNAGGASGDFSAPAAGEFQGNPLPASHALQSGAPPAHQGGMIDGAAAAQGVRLGEAAATDMIRHLSRSPDGAIEVALDPVELGRVRMSLHPQADGVTVAISADRGETVDLMRQHAGRLGEELRALGYENVTFSFSEDSGRSAQSLQENWRRDDPSSDLEPDGTAHVAHTRSGRVASGEGMDLRL